MESACWGSPQWPRKAILRKEHLREDLKDLQNHMALLEKSKAHVKAPRHRESASPAGPVEWATEREGI